MMPDSLLLSIPLETALPAGSYIWYGALVDPADGSVVDLSEKVLRTPL